MPQILQHGAKTGGVEFPFAQLAGEERGEFRREPMRIGAIVERGERVVRQERSAVDRPCVEAVAALYVTEDIFGRDARAWVGKRGENSVHVEYRYAVMEGAAPCSAADARCVCKQTLVFRPKNNFTLNCVAL
ncbi:hypothetical protein [Burkholderia ubonensis]|uniref:hypothetical protein n=1 Tax=Burkholderia ubonensis TaxID=101571 RepID=UPI001E643023|nr:hypothetical protein [Burkholderia ubonensis]